MTREQRLADCRASGILDWLCRWQYAYRPEAPITYNDGHGERELTLSVAIPMFERRMADRVD